MEKTKNLTIVVLSFFLLCLAGSLKGAPLGSAFTYQGRLIDSNYTAYGLYDFQFKLYDANSDGNQIGKDVNEPNVNVVDGYFTIDELDFNDAFDGNDRWLEISVRPSGGINAPNVLNPRQKVTPTPCAMYAKMAGSCVSDTIPRGVIVMWSGSIESIPSGWALCDGKNGTPNLSGRFIVGYDANDSDYNSIGKKGGEASHTLTIAEMPAHTHSSWVGLRSRATGDFWPYEAVTVGNTGSAGGDQPHENRPPYYALAYIMKL